jgi:hypothetical protein
MIARRKKQKGSRVPSAQETRRVNLQRLVDEHSASSVAKTMGWSGPSYVGQLLAGRRPITEKTARAIEEAFALAPRSLDSAPGEGLPISNSDFLAACIRSLGDMMQELNVQLSPAKMTELIVLVYEHSVKSGRIDLERIRRLLKLTQ